MCPITLALQTAPGVDDTTVRRAGGGSAHVQLPAPRQARPRRPRNQSSAHTRHYHIVPGSQPAKQNRQSGGAERPDAPLPRPSPRPVPTRAHAGEQLRAQPGERARRGSEAPLGGGAGRGQRVRSRELPSAAERSRAARCRGEAGRACRRLRAHCAAFLGSLLPLPSPGRPQNFYCLGTPPVRDEIAALRCVRARLPRRSGERAALARRALAPCASSPAERSREPRGGHPEADRAGTGAPRASSPLRTGSAQL